MKSTNNQDTIIAKHVVQTVVPKGTAIFGYFEEQTFLAEKLCNAALFRIRQRFTMMDKEKLTGNEKQILKEIELTCSEYHRKIPGRNLSYVFLEKMMRATKNPDFFSGLPMQTAQQLLKRAVRDFKGWRNALKSYKKDPSVFTGKPKMPGYSKKGAGTVVFTNQDCVYKDGFLKFPLTDERLKVYLPEGTVLKEVHVKPFYGSFKVICIYDIEVLPIDLKDRSSSIDFGVENIASLVINDGTSVIYKGGALKAMNQWFNKQRAHLTSHVKHSAALDALSRNRDNFMRDQLHKISSDIVKRLVRAGVSVLVLGKNKLQKQNVNIGRKNNQAFVNMPLYTLQRMITYKAEEAGITVICQEESYTSKASFLDDDPIPVYGKGKSPSFSGRRKGRGLYISKNGIVINADVNAAANILRKALPDTIIPKKMSLEVVRFYDLNKCTPVKRIAGA